MKLFESFGGKTHVRCECCQFPLILLYRLIKNKLKYNVDIHIADDGMRHQINNICTKKESYICSNTQCYIKICNRYYNALPMDTVTIVNTSLDPDEEDNEILEENVHSDKESNNSEIQFVNDEISVSTNTSICSNNVVNNIKNFICHTKQDMTLDTTDDNVENEQGFISTNAGDHYNNIIQNNNNYSEMI